jgi:nucleotidyltransferase substrate binding protein (TIGR01987 family)
MMDTAFLEKALSQLSKALVYAEREEDGDANLFEQFRNSVIQTFEYSFELSFKSLKRKLAEMTVSTDEIEALSYNDLIREGAKRGFITVPEKWFAFRVARNKTCHAYEETFAAETYKVAKDFLGEGFLLLERLKGK